MAALARVLLWIARLITGFGLVYVLIGIAFAIHPWNDGWVGWWLLGGLGICVMSLAVWLAYALLDFMRFRRASGEAPAGSPAAPVRDPS